MIVRILSFGPLREARGVSEEQIEVEAGTSVSALYARLFPRQHEGGLPVSYVRNLEHTSADTQIEDGDELAFLPPVGGG
jgi:molybdopterin converting factor small subunit